MTPDEARSLIQRSLGPPGDGPEPDLAQAWGVLAADAVWRIFSNEPPTLWREKFEEVLPRAARGDVRFLHDVAIATGLVCDGCGAGTSVRSRGVYVCPECRADQLEHARPPF